MLGLGFIKKQLDGYLERIVVKSSMGYISEEVSGPDKERQKDSDDKVLYRTYEETSWVRACVDVITRAVLSRGWLLVPVEGQHPIQANRQRLMDFFGNCNPQDTFDDLIEDCCRDLLVLHNSYWEIVRTQEGEPKSEPKELWSLEPTTMEVKADNHGLVLGYTQDPNGNKRVEFTPDQVLHWKIGARGSNVYGNPRLSALITSIETDLYAQTYNKAFFKKGAKVRGAIVMDGASPEQIQRNREYLATIAKKPEESKGDILLEGKMQYVKIGTEPKDMEFHQLRTFHRDEILAVFGCPPAKVSLIETGNIGAGSGDSQDRTLYEETVIPLQKKIAFRINKVLIREGFGIEDWELGFRPWVINRKEQAEVDKTYIEAGVLSVDEVRVSIGLEPRKAPTDSTEPPTPEDVELSKQFAGKKKPSISVAETAKVQRNEKNFEQNITNFFTRLAANIVSEVATIARDELKLKMRHGEVEHRFIYKTADNIPYYFPFYRFPIVIKGSRDFDRITEIINESEMEEMFFDNILEAAEEGGRLAHERLKRSLPQAVAANLGKYATSKALLDSVRVYSDDLSAFLKRSLDDQVKVQLLEGITAGEETRLLTKRVQNALQSPMPVKVRQAYKNDKGQWTHKLIERHIPLKKRSQIIARTETSRFMNEGALDAFTQDGINKVDIINPVADAECQVFIDGNPYGVNEARGLLPIHHECRCAFGPVIKVEPKEVPEPSPFQPLDAQEAEQLADELIPKGQTLDKAVQPRLQKLARANNATLEGLAFRVKGKASLSRKIQQESAQNRWTAAQLKNDDLNDVTRYTMKIDPANYAASAQNVLDELAAQGIHPIKTKNYWNSKQYRGINTVMQHPSGAKFELQFHTAESLQVKEKSHLLYLEAREKVTTVARRAQLEKQGVNLWKTVKPPESSLKVGTLVNPVD